MNQIDVESPNGRSEKILIDTIIKTIEFISLVLIVIPYCSIGLSALLPSITGQDYFILFPYGLFTILPTGILGLVIQFLRKLMKRPASTFSNFALKASVVTSIFGVFAYGLIYAVAG